MGGSLIYLVSVSKDVTTAVPGPAGVTIRPAERADLLAVLRIEKASFTQPWPYDAFEHFLGEPGFLVAVETGEAVVGYAVADVTPTYGGDLGHLKDLAVHPHRRGQGIGAAVLSEALSALAVQGATSVKLEVRASNDSAMRLYRQFGFESLRRVTGYYADGEDAIVMLSEL